MNYNAYTETPSVASRRSERLHYMAALSWGLLANFSSAAPNASLFQGLGLAVGILGFAIAQRSIAPLIQWTCTPAGFLVAVHAAFAVLSGVLNGSSDAAIWRYVLLSAAFSAALSLAKRSARDVIAVIAGLVTAGLLLIVVHLTHVDLGSLADPHYRVFLFLNTNGVGFIAAMTVVALLPWAFAKPAWRSLSVAAGIAAGCLLLLATKSRTALLVLLLATVVHLCLRVRRRGVRLVACTGMIGLGVLAGVGRLGDSRFAQDVTHVYMLDDEHRSVKTGTSRYDAWRYVVSEVAVSHPFLGVGPGGQVAFVEQGIGIPGVHNGFLANFAEVGLLGTLPLIVVVAASLWRARNARLRELVTPLVIGGLVESGAEQMLFSMGSSASLLFLVGIAIVATSKPGTRSRTVRGVARRGPSLGYQGALASANPRDEARWSAQSSGMHTPAC